MAFNATATDQDDPAQTLTFSLDADSLAAGMTITAGGAFAWTPTKAQGGSDYPVTITVTDDGTNPPSLTDSETFTITVLGPTWQNPRHPCDITGDGFIKPDDVLALINDLSSKSVRDLTAASPSTPPPPPFLDPSGDGKIGPLDVLTVINCLNTYGPGPVPAASGGEGERGDRIGLDGRAAPPPPAGGTRGTMGLDSGTSTIVASAAPSRGQRPEWPAALQPASSTVSKVVRTRIVWDALLDEGLETSELEEAISAISREVAHD